jgi:hypothetical protein
LAIGAVELVQIARYALLDLRQASLHLGAREVPVPVVDRLELAAVDRDAGLGEETEPAAERHEPGADLADGRASVLAKVGDRLVVGGQAFGQPHHLHVATGLALKPVARLDSVEIAVNIELQQNRWMIQWPVRGLGIDTAETEFSEIQLIDKHINHPNRIVLANPVLQAVGKQRRLPTSRPLNETLHPIPRAKHARES